MRVAWWYSASGVGLAIQKVAFRLCFHPCLYAGAQCGLRSVVE